MSLNILKKFPKIRPDMPTEYKALFEKEHLFNRTGAGFIENLAMQFESWMHKQIGSYSSTGDILEIGAGTLNHIKFEKPIFRIYDIVEICEQFYQNSLSTKYINKAYSCISLVPPTNRYDKIISIAVLEHAENLPQIIARSGLMLKNNGIMQHAIPTEGAFLWGLAWRITTGLSFRLRTGLSYKVIFNSEHINTASEIISIFKYFFTSVKVKYYPFPFYHGSCYSYIEAKNPDTSKCKEYLRTLIGSELATN